MLGSKFKGLINVVGGGDKNEFWIPIDETSFNWDFDRVPIEYSEEEGETDFFGSKVIK